MAFRRSALLFSLCVLSLFAATDVRATVVQVDGTIVPVATTPGTCAGDLQVCLNTEEGVSPPAATAIYAILDASQTPEIFQPSTATTVVFRDIGEGAGYENSFGYYNVGDDPTIQANLHPIMGCNHAHGTEAANGFVLNAEPGTVATVDFNVERTSGRWRGGFIAFYLITPQGQASSTNCGDFGTDFGHAYFTQRDLNNDGDFVHHLVYQSRITTNRFYFGFEDLFRGGDNDYEDMAMQVTGLTPPCAPSAEVCNNRDDDCDTRIDETPVDAGVACTCSGSPLTCVGGPALGVCRNGLTSCVSGGLVCRPGTSSPELCDLLDNNCNGTVDDAPTDVGAACDGSDGDLCNEGAIVCTSGTRTCSDTTPTNVELCNGIDDNCMGGIDEGNPGGGAACDGADADLCNEGITSCMTGSLRCSDMTASNAELCNGADDDCDTRFDESPTDVGLACSAGVGTCARAGATVCMSGVPRCNAVAGAPSTELCNATDDDCDSFTDEGFMLGSACLTPGICGAGVIECAGATMTRCSSAPGGSMSMSRAETCNTLDDDCDGRVDEGLTDLGACGTDTGECAGGRLRCVAGAPACFGGIGPSPEICDGLDNDCDGPLDERGAGGLTDEGDSCGEDTGECDFGSERCVSGTLVCQGGTGPTAELCNALDDDCNGIPDDSPTDVGTRCGTTDEGVCDYGATICVSGAPTCNGATDPTTEVCNGADDDCDGTVDDDPIDVGRTCGSAMGTCLPGTNACVSGAIVCMGGTVGTPEICNGIDDDCDNVIDDDPSDAGAACGISEGVCEEGAIRCIAGMLQCFGGVLPGTEVCNGLDDDCNGIIDDGDLCLGGVCRGAACSTPCDPTIEFPCAPGFLCRDGFCLEDACNGVACTPLPDGTRTVCDEGDCIPICDTLPCDAPNVCRRTDGACVGNNCIFLPYLCADDEACVEGECVSDPCDGVSCGATEFCRGGDCIGSCGGVRCAATEICRGGDCIDGGCDEVCTGSQVCDPVSGNCRANPCTAMTCAPGSVCDPRAGECVDDACRNITCPTGTSCTLGECNSPPAPIDGGVAGMDAGTDPRRDVLASGGGGTICSATPGRGEGTGVLGALFLAALVVARRRRARGGAAAWRVPFVVGLLALSGSGTLASGCAVDPYCVSGCGDERIDAGPIDGSRDGAADAADATDARVFPDGCVVGAPEECNEFDDDCDLRIDEDFDLQTDLRHCGTCATSCVRAGAETSCTAGACSFVRCFDGFHDSNADTTGPFPDTDGCEYHCFDSNGGVEACDTIDNDCDGHVDETFDLQGDETNCGECGRSCAFFRVTTSTCEMGVCEFDPMTDCVPGYIDSDHLPDTGCEFECTPTGAETCDGLDNDCDTRVDEDFNLDTNVMNCGRCGRACSFPHATPSCAAATCVFDPMTDCEPGFSDHDGVQLNGCEYPCVPTADPTEICDGVDNDCNGVVDGSTTDSGMTCNNAPGGVARGICTATGTIRCVSRVLSCIGAPEPSVERCNGMDDDCDGTTDDAPVDVGRVCMAPAGVCSAGFSVCNAGGTLGCVRAVGPSAELCNGLDDDCDGTIDDSPTDASLGMACGTSTGRCSTGINACVSGAVTCMGGVGPTLETCNGMDDDCDGPIDDDPVDDGGPCGSSIGACVPGSQICVGGALMCSGGVSAATETCDNRDQDCDARTDESLTQTCFTGPGTAGVGICRSGSQTCALGTFSACGGQITAVAETCDNRDEDCNGVIDNGVTRSCYTLGGAAGVGICRSGTQTCAAGAFGATCAGQIGPAAETCNNVDDDCDTRTDEALVGGGPLAQACYTGPAATRTVGTCRDGSQTCTFGAFGTCTGQVLPATEYCGDGLNTDCDGNATDAAEGCLTSGAELRLDGPTSGSGTGDESALGAFHSFDVQLASGGATTGRNVYAVWSDLRNGNADIFLVRSTDGGATYGTITNLTSYTTERAVAPQIVVGRNAAGTQDVVHVVFQVVIAGIRHVTVRTSADSGATFAAAVQLDTSANSDNFKHTVAASADGSRIVVAWEQLTTTTLARNVFSRVSVDSGATWAVERRISVNSGAAAVAGKPRVAVTSTGRFVFAWREIRSPRLTFDVFSTFSDDGTTAIPTAREVRIDTDASDNRASDDLRIASDGQRVYLVYQDLSTITSGDSDIVFARTIDNGATWGSVAILDDPSGEVSTSQDAQIVVDPRTALDTDDRVYVAWLDTREGAQVYLGRSDDSGATFTTRVRATQRTGLAQSGAISQPRMTLATTDTIVIAYTQDPTSGGNRRVLAAQTPDAGSTWNYTDLSIDMGTGDADMPAITRMSSATAPTLGAVIAWIDFRTSAFVNGDVYRVRVGR
jgi:Notch-like protein